MIILAHKEHELISISIDEFDSSFSVEFNNKNIQRFLGRIEFKRAENISNELLNLNSNLQNIHHEIEELGFEEIQKRFKTYLNDIAISYDLTLKDNDNITIPHNLTLKDNNVIWN